MKKISATFDGLKLSKSTLDYSVNIAKDAKAALSGVFLESFLYHGHDLEVLMGEQGISKIKLKHLLDKDKNERNNSVQLFEKACEDAAIDYNLHRDPGITIMEIIRESIYTDLLIVDGNEKFSRIPQQKPSMFLQELLSEVQCPLLVVPQTYNKIKKMVLLYDGGVTSVKAIRSCYELFKWNKNLPTDVFWVSEDDNINKMPEYELMNEFIFCHFPNAKFILKKGNPETKIIEYLNSCSKDTLVVMGANQRNRVSRWMKASMAEKVLKEIDLPVLIVNKN